MSELRSKGTAGADPRRKLKLLESHRASLELCVYCPKLCRAACPVSNVEASETVTPWGKMSLAYFAARGDVPLDARHADAAWACSSCYGCRSRCDHRNEVATVLNDARAELFEHGVAPAAAQGVATRFWDQQEALSREVHALALGRAERTALRGDGGAAGDGSPEQGKASGRARRPAAGVQVLVGCGYVRHAPEVARDALDAVEALLGAPARPVNVCCGLPLLYAGDRRGFEVAARRLLAELTDGDRFVAIDPGCARAVAVEYRRAGMLARSPELFVDIARGSLDQLQRSASEQRVRYHDPCSLGRGQDRYDAPREILARITGRPPDEFVHHREHADCSGGGGLVPVTRPATSAIAADRRIGEHRALGGGLLVTHCAQSLRRFRSRGEPAEDLVSLVARAVAPR